MIMQMDRTWAKTVVVEMATGMVDVEATRVGSAMATQTVFEKSVSVPMDATRMGVAACSMRCAWAVSTAMVVRTGIHLAPYPDAPRRVRGKCSPCLHVRIKLESKGTWSFKRHGE